MTAFTVDGEPVGKQRARIVRRKTGKVGSYTPAKTVSYEARVRAAAVAARVPLLDGAVCLDVVARWPYPAAWSRRRVAEAVERETLGRLTPKATKPDADNVLKAISDALEGVAYPHDGLVSCSRVVTAYGPRAETQVRVWQSDEMPIDAWWTDAARVRRIAGEP